MSLPVPIPHPSKPSNGNTPQRPEGDTPANVKVEVKRGQLQGPVDLIKQAKLMVSCKEKRTEQLKMAQSQGLVQKSQTKVLLTPGSGSTGCTEPSA